MIEAFKTKPDRLRSGTCVISVIGLFDDLKKLKTFQIKLLGQIAAAMVLLASGIVFSQVPLPFVGQFSLAGWVIR